VSANVFTDEMRRPVLHHVPGLDWPAGGVGDGCAFAQEGVIVSVRLRRRRRVCSRRGQLCAASHDSVLCRWRHLDLGAQRCHVVARLRRVKCPETVGIQALGDDALDGLRLLGVDEVSLPAPAPLPERRRRPRHGPHRVGPKGRNSATLQAFVDELGDRRAPIRVGDHPAPGCR